MSDHRNMLMIWCSCSSKTPTRPHTGTLAPHNEKPPTGVEPRMVGCWVSSRLLLTVRPPSDACFHTRSFPRQSTAAGSRTWNHTLTSPTTKQPIEQESKFRIYQGFTLRNQNLIYHAAESESNHSESTKLQLQNQNISIYLYRQREPN